RAVETARAAADEKERLAWQKETEAAAYKKKNEYLEQKLADIQAIARKQDEQIESFRKDTTAARTNAGRARGIRSIDTTADELCAKLAETGHGCQ
ncbi:MAG: hypothetical protein ACRD43_03645, partial [Pyrinomonadaceae bacterium]